MDTMEMLEMMETMTDADIREEEMEMAEGETPPQPATETDLATAASDALRAYVDTADIHSGVIHPQTYGSLCAALEQLDGLVDSYTEQEDEDYANMIPDAYCYDDSDDEAGQG